MTQSPASPQRTWRDILRVFFSGRMLVAAMMGFASGLPLLLTVTLLQAWMHDVGVDLGTIGLVALVGLPYTLKFLWAPLMDRFNVIPWLGRRRGWMLLTQCALILSIIGLGFSDPAGAPWLVVAAAFTVTFCSASQDIVIDAYRRESLADDEQGLGASFYVNGYRFGMLLASGGGLILADQMPFSQVYLCMAAIMGVGLVTTLLAREPTVPAGTPRTLQEAVVRPFLDYFARQDAVLILLFILLYKLGDTMASNLTTPFYQDIGFSKTEIGAVVKVFGFWAAFFGGLIGGALILRLGVYQALWQFGILQAVSILGFVALPQFGADWRALAAVIAVENLTWGMGTAAYMAFMAGLTNKKFTATQYALLSSLMGIPRVVIAAPTGYLAAHLGWEGYFIFCMVAAIPGLWLLTKFRSWMEPASEARAAQWQGAK